MKKRVSEFLIGLLFGTGLILSGMGDPAKVIGFLNLAGPWDPSLAFVMLGAIAVAFVAFKWVGSRQQSVLGDPMRLPTKRTLDTPLVAGSLLFGVGWGLAGYCPGPAVMSLGAGYPQAAVFVIAMVAGMLLVQLFQKR